MTLSQIAKQPVPPTSSHVDTSLEALIRTFTAAWKIPDCDALVQLMSPDVIWMNAYGEYSQGSQEAVERLRGTLCPSFDPDISADEATRMRRLGVRPIDGYGASIQLVSEDPSYRLSVALVCERAAGGWRIGHCTISRSRSTLTRPA